MVLVDTSVWINHFKKSNTELKKLLLDVDVLSHPYILGEIACGNIANRKEILLLMKSLPKAETTEDEEIFEFIEQNRLYGSGLGLIDVHLLASTILSKAYLWTLDKKLSQIATKFNVCYKPSISTTH